MDRPPCFRNVSTFSFSRPFNKSGRVGGERDIADIFIDKTFITCEETFPTVLRRSEIKKTWSAEISSIASAATDVKAKTAELEVSTSIFYLSLRNMTNLYPAAIRLSRSHIPPSLRRVKS